MKPSEWKGSVADKFVQDFVGVHSSHGVVEITMNSRNDGSSYPEWESFCLKYKLPDGIEYSVDTKDYANHTGMEFYHVIIFFKKVVNELSLIIIQ